MKSKTNQLTLIYIITAVLSFFTTVPKVFFIADYPFYNFERPFFVSFTGITFRYILSANDNRNRVILKTQEKIMTKSRSQMKDMIL
jgi:hypothetical protein